MMRFTVQGKPHEVDQERLSVAEAMEIKRATGLTVKGFLQGLREYDVDALVALVWLARSRAGEQISIAQVIASNFDLLADVDIEPPDEGEDQGEGEPVPTGGATPPTTPTSTSTTPPSRPLTPTSTGRTGSARSRAPSATPPPRSTR